MSKCKIAKKKNKHNNIFEPVKEQLNMLLEYIDLIEQKDDIDEEITAFLGVLMTVKQQCLIYLNNEIKCMEKNNGNYKF